MATAVVEERELLRYAFRRRIQDGLPLHLREETPATPEKAQPLAPPV